MIRYRHPGFDVRFLFINKGENIIYVYYQKTKMPNLICVLKVHSIDSYSPNVNLTNGCTGTDVQRLMDVKLYMTKIKCRHLSWVTDYVMMGIHVSWVADLQLSGEILEFTHATTHHHIYT